MEDIGILKLLQDPEATYASSSPLIKEIVAIASRKEIVEILKRTPGKDSIKFVGNLLRALGLDWQSRQVKTPDGQNERVYFVDRSHLNSREGVAIALCIETKFSKYGEGNWQNPQWKMTVEKEIARSFALTENREYACGDR